MSIAFKILLSLCFCGHIKILVEQQVFSIRYVYYSFNQIAEMSYSLEAISSFPVVKTQYEPIWGLRSQNRIWLPSLPGLWLMSYKSVQVISINPSLDHESYIGSATHYKHDSIPMCTFTHSFILSFIHLFNRYSLDSYYVPGIVLSTKDTAGNKTNKNPYPCGTHILSGGHKQYAKIIIWI